MKREDTNIWKIAFFSFLGFIIAMILVGMTILYFVLQPVEIEERQAHIQEDIDGATFTVSTTKEDVNYWIQKEVKETMGEELSIYLADLIFFETSINVLGMNVPIEMVFAPNVTEEGNLVLYEHSFRVGVLQLSSERVLQLMQTSVDFPDWMEVIPPERKIFLNIRDGISDEMQVKVQKFDLDENEIVLEVTIK
ncbi:YpmS family protein [Bacillus shivajii]|uniref:YpmS family protein n=1 Tax=Bacillus shivajii TaxID=1983719 RepID=UPI001CF9DF9C|nr:YpmS family protein [Bacillus shivajii]UCZ54321.1 YpmS family protein [Bacillus shivajii]